MTVTTRRAKKTKVDPEKVYTAWQGGSGTVDGVDYTFAQGTRLRGDHPFVKQMGDAMFAEEGTPQSELPTVYDEAVKAGEAAGSKKAPTSPRIDPKTPLGDLFIASVGIVMSKSGPVPEGTIVTKDDPRIAELPEANWAPLIDRLGLAENIDAINDATVYVRPYISPATPVPEFSTYAPDDE